MKTTLLFLLTLPLMGQVTVSLSTPAPSAPVVSASVTGNPGNAQYSYWVIANYPGGSAISNPALVQFAPVTLTNQNFIQVNWNGLPQATSYDLVRMLPPAQFSGTCSACLLASGLTTTSMQDTGGVLTDYAASTSAVPATGQLYINTRDYTPPQLRRVINGVDSGFADNSIDPAFGGPCPTGATCDFAYKTLAAAFAAAGKNTLYCTKNWNSVPSATFTAPLVGISNCKIQPGTGQVVTFSGPITAPPVPVFDESLGGLGSVQLTSVNNPTMYVNWFGAKTDSVSDDLPAWNATISACPPTGCGIQIPVNATSHVSGTVVLPINKPIIISGSGRTSSICGTGITVIQLRSAGQSLQNMSVCDPIGSASTIGILIFGGTEGTPDANQILLFNVFVHGNASNLLGVGVQLQSSVNTMLDTVTEAFFGVGLNSVETSGSGFNTTTRLDKTLLLRNGTIGWNIATSSDVSATASDFEGNSTLGIKSTGQNVTISDSHFESNALQLEVAGGFFFGNGNDYAGGTIQVDSAGNWTSTNDQLSDVTVLNNSGGGGGAVAGATIRDATFDPTISTASAGWTQVTDRNHVLNNICFASGVLTPCTVTSAFTGATAYSFDQLVKLPYVLHTGTTFTVTGCSATPPVGTTTGGVVTSGTTGTCTISFLLPHVPTFWICAGSDASTGTSMAMVGLNSNQCTLTGTTVSGNTITFTAQAF